MHPSSKTHISASLDQCRWLPCPPANSSSEDGGQLEEVPVVFSGWSEDAKQHMLGVADLQLASGALLGCTFKSVAPLANRVTDLQVAKVRDVIVAAGSNSAGGVSMLLMQLPEDLPAATTADLQFLAAGGPDASGQDSSTAGPQHLHEVQQLHKAPAASVDINPVKEVLLSVSGDGSICLTHLQQLGGAAGHCFKQASAWGGFRQGRWVDSNTFATAGVLGGLQLWDERSGPSPVSKSSSSWGHTGCGQLDKQLGALRQLLCLDVHPSRPTLAATGASAGTVAVWDLRFQAAPLALSASRPARGDVSQCKFDLHSPHSTAAVPSVLYSTLDGALCAAQDAAAAADAAANGGGAWHDGSSGSGSNGLLAEVLHREQVAICSFDVEEQGSSVLAATGDEQLLVLQMEAQTYPMQ